MTHTTKIHRRPVTDGPAPFPDPRRTMLEIVDLSVRYGRVVTALSGSP